MSYMMNSHLIKIFSFYCNKNDDFNYKEKIIK